MVGLRETPEPAANGFAPDMMLESLWFATLQRCWNSLALVPVDQHVPLAQLARLLINVGRQHGEKTLQLIDARGTKVEDVQNIVNAIKAADDRSSAIVMIDAIVHSPAAAHILRATSAAIVVATLGRSTRAACREATNAAGERVIGAIALRSGLSA